MAYLECKKEPLPPGPWVDDIASHPDAEYKFVVKGMMCTLRRMPGWNWNGYVQVPVGHRFAKKTYQQLEDMGVIHVHGGLTYGPGNGVFGFDTAHELEGDLVPALLVYQQDPQLGKLFEPMSSMFGGGTVIQHFWTFEEVQREVQQLAEQLAPRATN